MNKNEERNEAGFNWPVVIRNPNARASLDYYYGPYDSVDSMKSSVPNELWVPGFTAAVQSEDGTVEEWWVQGEGAKAGFVKKHELVDGGMRFMGKVDSLSQLQAKESPSKGDVWQTTMFFGGEFRYPLYFYDGSNWVAFAQDYALTVNLPNGTSKTYDGSKSVTVDLSKVPTNDKLDAKLDAKLDELKDTYVTVDRLDDLATWRDGDYTLLGKRLDSHQVCFRTPQGSWAPTGVTAGTNNITLAGGDAKLRLTDKEVGMARNGSKKYYRANPLVLAVRLIFPSSTKECRIKELYNPFKLPLLIYGSSEGVYEFHHFLCSYYVSKSIIDTNKADEDEWTRNDTSYTYTVMGDACKLDGEHREQLYFSVIQRYENHFIFRTADDDTVNRFTSCDIIIFDFNTL